MKQNTTLTIRKTLIGLCALTTLATLTYTSCKTDINSKVIGTAGALLAGCGLGVAMGGYRSNSDHKKERD